jgi:hypothetical protein
VLGQADDASLKAVRDAVNSDTVIGSERFKKRNRSGACKIGSIRNTEPSEERENRRGDVEYVWPWFEGKMSVVLNMNRIVERNIELRPLLLKRQGYPDFQSVNLSALAGGCLAAF